MIKAVIDTNVLVSALLNPLGNPAKVLDHVLNGTILLCYDNRIIAEYEEVLLRPKFGFNKKAVKQVVEFLICAGISIVAIPLPVSFEDENDKMFFEVADSAKAYLVTGNTRHFPKEPFIVNPQDFINILEIRD